ncbi:MAG: hypothetical protein ACYTFA_07035 [Planctomycetota bacterium]|jgi:hypothetical protein
MPDEPAPDPLPTEPAGAGKHTPAEDELDTLLETAASLAGDVTEDVGAPAEQPASAQAIHSAGQTDNDAPNLDAQLAELDVLLEEANREIGHATPPTNDDDAEQTMSADAESADSDADSPTTQPESSSPHVTAAEAEPASSTRPATEAPDPSPSPADDLPTDIDTQLAASDGPLDEAGRQGNAQRSADYDAHSQTDDESQVAPTDQNAVPNFMEEPTRPEGAPDTSPEETEPPAAADGTANVPDFMAEFTTPEVGTETGTSGTKDSTRPPSSAAQATGGPASPTAPTPGVVEPRDLGAVGSPDTAPAKETAIANADPSQESDKASPAKAPAARSRSPAMRLLGRAAAPLSPLALKACEGGMLVLETMDRPAQRLGYWPRRFIGWLALATLGASLIVYVASLF